MHFRRGLVRGAACALALIAFAPEAHANERHFPHTYESSVLPEGGREFEVWTTWRGSRRRFYSAFDHRFEYELGLTSRLQTAFYFNVGSVTDEDALGKRSSRFEGQGVSSEWKYKLLDSVADPVGLALYGEANVAPDAFSAEAKLIVDKRAGDFLFAGNLVCEPEWILARKTVREVELEATVAAAYFVLPNVGVGLEVSSLSELGGRGFELEWSTLHVGPVVSTSRDGWWVAASLLRQLPAPVRDRTGALYVLQASERYNARLLFSFHL